MIVSCLLLKMGLYVKPEEALDLFAAKRTTTHKDKHIKEQRVSSICCILHESQALHKTAMSFTIITSLRMACLLGSLSGLPISSFL